MAQRAERREARFPGGPLRELPGLFGLQGFYLRRSVDDTNLGFNVRDPSILPEPARPSDQLVGARIVCKFL
jgi:hypothetical protein